MGKKINFKINRGKAKPVAGAAAVLMAISDFSIEEAVKFKGVYEKEVIGHTDEGELVLYIKTSK